MIQIKDSIVVNFIMNNYDLVHKDVLEKVRTLSDQKITKALLQIHHEGLHRKETKR